MSQREPNAQSTLGLWVTTDLWRLLILVKRVSSGNESTSKRITVKLDNPIYDVTPMTMLDYPEQLACIVWFAGCNMSCPYCYNPKIVQDVGTTSFDNLYAFLDKRKGLLDAVVLSGGECTIHPGIIDLCREIKKMGFLVKIDTNGSNPTVIAKIVNLDLVDFIALDYKAPEYKFKQVSGSDLFDTLCKTMDILHNDFIGKFEIRTTVHSELLNEDDINFIINDLSLRGYANNYYLQKCIDNTVTLSELPQQQKWLDLGKLSDLIKVEVREQ